MNLTDFPHSHFGKSNIEFSNKQNFSLNDASIEIEFILFHKSLSKYSNKEIVNPFLGNVSPTFSFDMRHNIQNNPTSNIRTGLPFNTDTMEAIREIMRRQ